MTIRLVLAEDNFLLREGVRRMLESQPELEVVAACRDLDELLAAIDAQKPDVVMTDIRMPPDRNDEGIRAAAYCRREYPDMGVLLLSQYIEPAYVRVLLGQGTEGRGHLLKERVGELEELLLAVKEVAGGGSAIDPKVVGALVQVRARSGGGELSRLTPRELEVLGAMAEGQTNAAIASFLFISQRAVEKHINSVFAKLGLSGDQQSHPRVRAVLMYLAEGKS
jgi:DNA-binding NarL/FixJ family response regulator